MAHSPFASAVPIPPNPDAEDSDTATEDHLDDDVHRATAEAHHGPPPAATNDSAQQENFVQYLLQMMANEAGKNASSSSTMSLQPRLEDAHLAEVDPTLVPSPHLVQTLLQKPRPDVDFLSTPLETFLGSEEDLPATGSKAYDTSRSQTGFNKKGPVNKMPIKLALLGHTLVRWVVAGSVVSSLPKGLLLSHMAATMRCADLYGTAAAIAYHRRQTATAAAEVSMGKPLKDTTLSEFNNLRAFECKQAIDNTQRKASSQGRWPWYWSKRSTSNYNYNNSYKQNWRSTPYDDWWSKDNKNQDSSASQHATPKKSAT
ncbi:hypothetical protein FOZ63_022315 [Perkinsus olseni]|uniref:Uncharacterized protein n=1 Tax=Perkinsus olseni TaxID=32597 RepID=A0A7J6STS8_PEROL|nr:hypothetical protein FOZ63_022315 [Perkinsus olseni]KAF4735586.1 hypothetical protein FOZ62_021803 [Perkinsus olseni]